MRLESANGEAGLARRFVKFGSVALCGSCLDELRRRLRAGDAPFVEADARREQVCTL